MTTAEKAKHARLIAAAPELLEALETCFHALTLHDEWLERQSYSVMSLKQAEAAIRKAKGENAQPVTK